MELLYLMNVDWTWIRQRPHILARALGELYDVKVLYPSYLTRPWRMQRTPKAKKSVAIPQLPFHEGNGLLNRIQSRITKQYLKNMGSYDAVWFCGAEYFDWMPKGYKGIVIYDVMDDVVALQKTELMRHKIQRQHRELLRRADILFVTSEYLYKSLSAEEQKKAVLVRNGVLRGEVHPPHGCNKKDSYRLGYVGTISEWLDYDLLRAVAQAMPNIKLDFYGPKVTQYTAIPNLTEHGIVEHNKIYVAVKDCDCLMMPFVINQITLAVDPVKLYEYISFGKCIISVFYPEIERFAPFVYFYHTQEELIALLQKLAENGFPTKYSQTEQLEFLDKNTWEARVGQVERQINSKFEQKIKKD